jgi:ethanolamine utilization protein EutN
LYLGRVVGNVVSTRKDEHLTGAKLLIVRQLTVDDAKNELKEDRRTMVAVDTVGAGAGDVVLMATGSPATRNIEGVSKMPADVTIVGIVDYAELQG